MINDRSRQAVDNALFGEHFRRPLYGSYNFARIVPSLPWLFTGRGQPALPLDVFGHQSPPFDHVALCFIDAFGWQYIDRALELSPFLRRAAEQGVLSKMTSMFPSTTTAHVTAIHTGQTPAVSGAYAWQYHEPSLGAIIEPLPFAFHNQPRESLRITAVDPSVVFPGPSIYPGLAALGVRSFVLQPTEIAHSTCNKIFTAGAQQRPFKSLAEGLVMLKNILLDEAGPTYSFLYWDKVDSQTHVHGPDSEETMAEVEMVFLAFERLLHERLAKARRTLILITADHGQSYTGPAPILVNRDMPDVVPLLQKDRLGRVLAPAGSRRDLFLHVVPGQTQTVIDGLRAGVEGRAEVYATTELIAQGFFGEEPASERLLARVGDVAVLPYAGESVWWLEAVADKKAASHGGLSPQEMEIPLFAVAYG